MKRKDRPPGVNELLDLCAGDTELLTSLALHFLAQNEGISSVLVGSKSVDHVKKAIILLAMPVDEDLLAKAERVVRKA